MLLAVVPIPSSVRVPTVVITVWFPYPKNPFIVPETVSEPPVDIDPEAVIDPPVEIEPADRLLIPVMLPEEFNTSALFAAADLAVIATGPGINWNWS